MGKKKSATLDRKPSLENWDAVEIAMEQYGAKSAELAAERAALTLAIMEATRLHTEKIATLSREIEELEGGMQLFALAHDEEFDAAPDGDGRTHTHSAVTIGLRKHPDTVKVPHRKADQQAALDYLRIYRESLVRLVPEFDKAAILAELQDGNRVTLAALADHGIKLEAGTDEFFVKTMNAE